MICLSFYPSLCFSYCKCIMSINFKALLRSSCMLFTEAHLFSLHPFLSLTSLVSMQWSEWSVQNPDLVMSLPNLKSFTYFLWKWKCHSLSHAQLLAAPWTVAHQVPLCMGFSRQECWNALPCPSPGDLPNPETESQSPALLCKQILCHLSHWDSDIYIIRSRPKSLLWPKSLLDALTPAWSWTVVSSASSASAFFNSEKVPASLLIFFFLPLVTVTDISSVEKFLPLPLTLFVPIHPSFKKKNRKDFLKKLSLS